MKVVFDENLSPKLAYAFAALLSERCEVAHLRQIFGPNVTDVEWIPKLSSEGRCVVISGDRRITRNKAEYHVFRRSNLIGFFLHRDLYQAPVLKQMERLVALWDRIEKESMNVEGGAMFLIRKSGSRLEPFRSTSG